ncbi:D-cysteine desulfhydrase family protein [Mycobacterium sp. OTB74]|uniref:D-cysteine desulfhydrase family protein n=1 Tax=Mycobacterium sp. OTB74 TaxID=1853452 RepID=UPI0024736EA4|nr:D-cysteine desulfhydrase family protein [Mycobacterium sp. OTB74]
MSGEGQLAQLNTFARHQLIEGATHIQRLDGLASRAPELLSGVNVFVKRDDHMALGGGGNKLRKLEFHIGRALAEGCDTVVTVGGLQSNHARLTAAVAAKVGLHCELVLSRIVPRADTDYENNGNMLLDKLFGARIHVLDGSQDALTHVQERAQTLRTEGHRVLVIPTGGSTGLGALGYVRCAAEVAMQEAELGLQFSEVIVPNGSGGTQAGLIAGFATLGRAINVRGFSVLAAREYAQATTATLVREACGLLGIDAPPVEVDVDDAQLGPGYGVPTRELIDAVQLLARIEGLMLDPVYSGKAFAGLLADIKAGRHQAGVNVLFVMTGGQPGLYAYPTTFDGP